MKVRNRYKKVQRVFVILLLTALLPACTSYRQVPYLQSAGEDVKSSYKEIVENVVAEADTLYDARIQPKDLLTISVNTLDPQAAAPFNLTTQTAINAATPDRQYVTAQPTLQQYLVSNSGEIDFPVVGRLKVGGLTKEEAESMIRDKLRPYLKEAPIVTVRMSNYKISVLGEVNRPGTFIISNEKVNVFEALAMAGDMTVYGIRNNVKLIRENSDGVRQVISLNLNKQDIIHSPYYQLQQNDILYIMPNKTKAGNAAISNSTTIWISVVGTLTSLAGLIVSIVLKSA